MCCLSGKWKLQRFRDSLVYALIGEEIRVYAVAHHRREPGYWLSRLSTRGLKRP